MSAHEAQLPIAAIAGVSGVQLSGDYGSRARPASANAAADALLRRHRTIPAASHGTSGAPRAQAQSQGEQRHRPTNDIVARAFQAVGPNRLWVAGLMYMPTAAGLLFIAVVLDAQSGFRAD